MNIPPYVQWLEQERTRLLEVVGWPNAKHIHAYFTTRMGGVSDDPYKSLNLGLHVGDASQTVLHNRELLSNELGISLSSWVAAEQVHGNRVEVITKSDVGKGVYTYSTSIPKTDALVTNIPGIALSVFAADCVPILFYAEPAGIGVAHAGWRGTVGQIAAKTVQTMCDTFHCVPSQIHAVIGPSIGPCCYEVDRNVYDALAEIGLEDVCNEVSGTESETALNKHWMCDLWEANRRILLQEGIPTHNIHLVEQCTSCQNHLYYSHRKEHGKTGRHIGLIYMDPI